jgi:SAM-dependent methyltransferase
MIPEAVGLTAGPDPEPTRWNYILATRTGGAGDLLMLEPTLEALYYRYAPARLILRTYPDYGWVLDGHPLIWKTIYDHYDCPNFGLADARVTDITDLRGVLPAPCRVHGFNFCGVVERFSGLHGVESFAALADVGLLRRTPSLGRHGFTPNHRIVVQLRQAGDGRDLLADDLPLGWLREREAVLVAPGSLAPGPFRDLVCGCDLFIGPDSCGLHLAHAAGVRKIVGFYSDRFPAAIRAYPGIRPARDRTELACQIRAALEEPRYPDFLNRGSAITAILGKALLQCRGRGLDVGSSQWPLPGAIPIASPAERGAFAEGPFDYIFSSHCLEHIEAWQEELRIWEGALRPGGTLFLYLPHPMMERWRPGGSWVGDEHKWSPDPVALVRHLNEATGLRVEEYGCYPDAWWSFHIVARKL